MRKITKKQIKDKLSEVIDPELNISIIDLGLVYQVKVNKDDQVTIIMTLTTIGCPLISIIEQEIKNKLGELDIDSDKVKVELTFDPPWSMEMISERGKALLGI